jgi:hypothetical protein
MNPGPIEESARVAGGVVEALRREPISLALVVINLVFLIVFYGVFREVSSSAERRDTLLSELAKNCTAPQR